MSRAIRVVVGCVYALIAVVVITIAFVAIVIETPVCNIHGHHDSLSPNGSWRATWTTTGCSRFFLTIFWHSKIVVSNTTRHATTAYLIFKSDSAHDVTFDWLGHNILHIEINHVANITLSKRHVPGLTIAYSVRSGALRYANKFMNGETARINSLVADRASAGARLTSDDRRAEVRVDRNFRGYLRRFLTWSQIYAHTPN